MAVKYTEEQLNSVDKSFLIQLLLQQQEQLEAITKELHASNEKMQLLMEQVLLGKRNLAFRSGGLPIICPKRNWKQNSVSRVENSYQMPFLESIILYL